MKHQIDAAALGPDGAAMTKAIGSCVHCGFCLPTCPTYVTLREELDSPRGRIVLMKDVLEGTLALEEALPAIDNCLGCQACVTACPSGVEYGDLITAFRLHTEPQRKRPLTERLQRALAFATLPHPRRFAAAVRAARLVKPLARFAPKRLEAMLALVPAKVSRAPRLPHVLPSEGPARARVALLAGCAQQVLAPQINSATLRVLARNGIETVVPEAQGCCGALDLHAGNRARAAAFAATNLAAFPHDVDAIVTNAAGCGSGMRDYPHLFAGSAEAPAAEDFAARVADICVVLDRLGLVTPPRTRRPVTVAYHDACHLAHAQGVRAEPRGLLASIPGVTVVEPAEWELCCGSAGTYNLERPAVAAELGERKARNLAALRPDFVVTGNIGCITQLRFHLEQLGQPIPVLHTLELLDRAYIGNL